MKPSLSSVTAPLADRFAALSPREKYMIIGLGVIAVLVLVIGMIMPLDRSVAAAQVRVGKKQADLQWMRHAAPELVGTAPPPAATESLLLIAERSARESGLGPSLAGSYSLKSAVGLLG